MSPTTKPPPLPPLPTVPSKQATATAQAPSKAGAQAQPRQFALPKVISLKDLSMKNKSRILLLGRPGSGKSACAFKFPRPLILDLDLNAEGALRYLITSKGLTQEQINSSLYVKPFVAEDGSIVARPNRWAAITRTITAVFRAVKAGQLQDFDTIVLDGLSALSTAAMDEVRRQEKKVIGDPFDDSTQDEQFSQPDYGRLLELFKQFFFQLMAYEKNVIVTGHVEMRDVKKGKEVVDRVCSIACPGSFRDQVAGMFTEVWLVTREASGSADQPADKVFIQTAPNRTMVELGLKTGLQLPGRFELDFGKIEKELS